ncbi:MAG: DoxX family protein [Planctomycetes bacterium]|nr:DoxX family protein [Planctomycetota bacterium]
MAMTGPSRVGPLILRLAAGAALVYHGYQKLFGAEPFDAFVEKVRGLNLPLAGAAPPEILAHVAAWGALAGGALLILGFVTRFAALVNACTLVVCIWKCCLGADLLAGIRTSYAYPAGYEYPLLLLAAALALVFTGPGTLSIDGILVGRRRQ